jgi:hypothetical protein
MNAGFQGSRVSDAACPAGHLGFLRQQVLQISIVLRTPCSQLEGIVVSAEQK